MKTVRKIVLWMLISLFIQFVGLFYINNYFLSSQTNIKTKKVASSKPKKQNIEIRIPENATNINMSYDGKYVSYYMDNIIKIFDTENGKEKQIKFNDSIEISFYKWLPDRNRMLIAEKHSSQGEYYFNLEYYEVDKDIKENIKKLEGFNIKSEIDDIQESPITNVIYIKMDNGGRRTSLYRVNIMKEMEKVKTQSYIVGDIGILLLKDKLIYEDGIYHKIYISGEDAPLNVDGVNNPVWIGVDAEDKIYIGDAQNDKISTLYYGKIDGENRQYNIINLDTPVSKDNIYISDSGEVYVNDNLKGIFMNVLNGKQYKYEGKFIQMYNGGIAVVKNGILTKIMVE